MFKTPQEATTKVIKPFSPTQKNTQTNRDLLEFWARQIHILKDIADTCPTVHPQITVGRLRQCSHLMEKKLGYALGENPEHYHDYIQDFYDNQLTILRSELNTCKLAISGKDRELGELKAAYNILDAQLQSEKEKTQFDLEHYSQSSKLKKQLDHCQVLLKQNSQFIREQSSSIENLTQYIQKLEKSSNSLRKKYEEKVLWFDNHTREAQQNFALAFKKLESSLFSCQDQMKEMAIMKVKLVETRENLCRELEVKGEENRLLTKKIYEQELVIGKYEKELTMRQKINEELYGEIDEYQNYKAQEESKSANYRKELDEKKSEINRLENRLRDIAGENESRVRKISNLHKNLEEWQAQKRKLSKKIDELEDSNMRLEKLSHDMGQEKRSAEKSLSKLTKQRQRFTQQMKLMQIRQQQLYQHGIRDRQNVKEGIMAQVSELVSITQRQESTIKQIRCKLAAKEEQLTRQIHDKQVLEEKFEKMNDALAQITQKLQILRTENHDLRESKSLIEQELSRLCEKVQNSNRINKQFEAKIMERDNTVQEYEILQQKYEEEIQKLKKALENLQLQNSRMTSSRRTHLVSEDCPSFEQQRKTLKEEINKKHFEIKQLESKVKVLQDEIREESQTHEKEKAKMSLKIKQLQELLVSGFSDSGRA